MYSLYMVACVIPARKSISVPRSLIVFEEV